MAAGELRSVTSLVGHPSRPGLEKLSNRLRGLGFNDHETAMLCRACNVCVPRGRLRGLGLAVLQLSKLFPGDAEVREDWLPLVRQWFTRDPEARRSFALQPYATNAPVTAFLAGVAGRLPVELARAIFVRMLDVLAHHADAERSCYVLYLAAKHLADQQATNPVVASRISAGEWPVAVAAMRPPSVTQPGVLEGYQAALRNALGQRKPAVHKRGREHSEGMNRMVDGHSNRVHVEPPPASLRERIVHVGLRAAVRQPTQLEPEPDEEEAVAVSATGVPGVRRSSGLQTNIALGVARDLKDLHPLKLHRLLERLVGSDLDRAEQWVLRVALTTMYCTGWPAGVLTALAEGTTARNERDSGTVVVHGELIGPWTELAGRSFRIMIHPQLLRMFDSLRACGLFRLPGGEAITSGHISVALRVLCAEDSVRVTQAMLRGAVWRVGRENGWTPERLIICTCKSDPGFRNDVHYLPLDDELDARPLHALMLTLLASAQRRQEMEPRHAVASR